MVVCFSQSPAVLISLIDTYQTLALLKFFNQENILYFDQLMDSFLVYNPSFMVRHFLKHDINYNF